LPNGTEIVSKLLSEDPLHYADAPTEGIRRVLAKHDTATTTATATTTSSAGRIDYSRGKLVSTASIVSIRMGTTVAANALLERDWARMALLITKGFADVLDIGNQARPDIFDLTCQ
jgi:5-oxoprolinase (ATP-hydrolysing)